MKRVLWIIPAILVLCVSARAQETPAWEIGGGYSYLHANMNNNNFTGPQFDLSGGHATVSENLNNWFGGRIEFNAFNGSVLGTNVSMETITYGPVFSYRKFERFTPFGHVQLGAVHAGEGYLGISKGAFKFAMTGGGGVDVNLNRRLAVRFQGDYLMTRFLDLRQDNLQFSSGLVVRFGRK
jgi:opacity protein-like surface antigen